MADVIARLANGEEWGFASAEKALELHPDATIISGGTAQPVAADTTSAPQAAPDTTETPAPDEAEGTDG